MPRFVILEHDWPELHWDFMLEQGDVLKTWRLLVFPTADCELAVQALPDHRLVYLDYEGPVSGNRGAVIRRESGEYSSGDAKTPPLEWNCRGIATNFQVVVISPTCFKFQF